MHKKYQILMAKTGRDSEQAWLPLWMHLRDTAGIMKRLASKGQNYSIEKVFPACAGVSLRAYKEMHMEGSVPCV